MKKSVMQFCLLTVILLCSGKITAQAPNFHIYLSLGQSNMEGNARVEAQDTVDVNDRFKVLAAVDCPDLGREKGNGTLPFHLCVDAKRA